MVLVFKTPNGRRVAWLRLEPDPREYAEVGPMGTYSWVIDRTQATPLSEEDASAFLLLLSEDVAGHEPADWTYSSEPVGT